eukprot:TRINITY_DN8298_c0_g1_i1.p1 TRINITY_DN8298_c0_g1~~TRINITY_DN8298_c0_g1_i1.p1  ORF type:complete len:615 (+),score=194.17 TRINITY_DN8298_c0_g1_i1:128-1972(+)
MLRHGLVLRCIWRSEELVLTWRDANGGLHKVLAEGPHPYEAYKQMVLGKGEIPLTSLFRLLRQCHKRLLVPLVGEIADDVSDEVIPTRKLFNAVLKEHDDVGIRRSLFRYLCKARMTDAALEMKDGGLDMDYGCYVLLLLGLVSNGKVKMTVKYYDEMREGWMGGTLNCRYRTALNTSKVMYAMLYMCSKAQNPGGALNFFRAFRISKMLEAAVIGANPPTFEYLKEHLEIPPYLTTALSQDYGPSRPYVSTACFVLLLNSTTTPHAAAAIYDEALAQNNTDSSLLTALIEKCIYHDDVHTANTYMKYVDTISGSTSETWAAYMKLLNKVGAAKEETFVAILRKISSTGERVRGRDAVNITAAVAKVVEGNPELASWIAGYFGETVVKKHPEILTHLDRIRGRGEGVNLGEVRGSSMVTRDLRWERSRTLAQVADDGWEEQPPWVAALKEVASDFEKVAMVFQYEYCGKVKKFKTSAVGDHPYVQLQDLIKDLGNSPSTTELIWSSCGDAGTSTLLQISRIRLVYSMSITMLGGFEDVLLHEVSLTHLLFKEAGLYGVSNKWSWKALRIYEDEVDDIIKDYSVRTSALSSYVRHTVPTTEVSRPERRNIKASSV